MIDFDSAREQMVDNQVRTVDVTDHAVISAMLRVPREKFVPESLEALSYTDQPLQLSSIGGEGRSMLQPATLAKLLQQADLKTDDVVMVVGSGSGYGAALCALQSMSVVALEENSNLAEFSREALTDNGFDNVVVVDGPVNAGLAKEAPYNAIIMMGSVSDVPSTFLDQLAEGGRLVAVIGSGNSGDLTLFEKRNGLICEAIVMNCAVQSLPGFEQKAEFVF